VKKAEKSKARGDNRRLDDGQLLITTTKCHLGKWWPSPPLALPPAGWWRLGVAAANTHRLLLCDLLTSLVLFTLFFASVTQLNLLTIKVNKTSKNPKDYIIIW